MHHCVVTTNLEAKNFEGTSVFAQILAASGIIGVIPFIIYLCRLLYYPLRLAKKLMDPDMSKLLIGMVLGLFYSLIIVQSAQNILRPYLWLHIALLCSTYSIAKKYATEKNQEPLAS